VLANSLYFQLIVVFGMLLQSLVIIKTASLESVLKIWFCWLKQIRRSVSVWCRMLREF